MIAREIVEAILLKTAKPYLPGSGTYIHYNLEAAINFAYAKGLEDAAKVCDGLVSANLDGCNPRYVPETCAKAIRALTGA